MITAPLDAEPEKMAFDAREALVHVRRRLKFKKMKVQALKPFKKTPNVSIRKAQQAAKDPSAFGHAANTNAVLKACHAKLCLGTPNTLGPAFQTHSQRLAKAARD